MVAMAAIAIAVAIARKEDIAIDSRLCLPLLQGWFPLPSFFDALCSPMTISSRIFYRNVRRVAPLWALGSPERFYLSSSAVVGGRDCGRAAGERVQFQHIVRS